MGIEGQVGRGEIGACGRKREKRWKGGGKVGERRGGERGGGYEMD